MLTNERRVVHPIRYSLSRVFTWEAAEVIMAANNNNYNNFEFRFPHQSQGQFQTFLNQPAMNSNPQFDPYVFNNFQPWNTGAFQFIPDTATKAVSPAPSRSSSERSHISGEDDASEQEPSTKKFRWSEEQTRVLLEEWKERIDRVESTQNNEAWKEIVKEVNKGGSKKTLKQCKDKLKNLKQAYKEAKAKNKKTGESPQRSPFYDELDEVLGTRAVITMPGVKQVGTAEYDPSTPGSSTSDVDLEESDVEEVQSENKGKGKRKAEDDGKQRQKKKRAKKDSSTNFVDLTERFLEAQNQQMEMLNRSQERTENLLIKMEMDQRKADEENRARDREFLLEMAELLAKK